MGSAVINLMLPHLCSTIEPFKILEDKVKAGELGVKSGKGFKKYDDVGKVIKAPAFNFKSGLIYELS